MPVDYNEIMMMVCLVCPYPIHNRSHFHIHNNAGNCIPGTAATAHTHPPAPGLDGLPRKAPGIMCCTKRKQLTAENVKNMWIIIIIIKTERGDKVGMEKNWCFSKLQALMWMIFMGFHRHILVTLVLRFSIHALSLRSCFYMFALRVDNGPIGF